MLLRCGHFVNCSIFKDWNNSCLKEKSLEQQINANTKFNKKSLTQTTRIAEGFVYEYLIGLYWREQFSFEKYFFYMKTFCYIITLSLCFQRITVEKHEKFIEKNGCDFMIHLIHLFNRTVRREIHNRNRYNGKTKTDDRHVWTGQKPIIVLPLKIKSHLSERLTDTKTKPRWKSLLPKKDATAPRSDLLKRKQKCHIVSNFISLLFCIFYGRISISCEIS